jgi:transitional endoplasmic reticulum ATPase
MIDPALLRPGRFDRLLLVHPPDAKAREKILKIHTNGMSLTEDVDLKKLAIDLEGYVGADLAAICREAVMIGLREDLKIEKISMYYFEQAKSVIHPSANAQITKEFEKLEKKLLGKSEIARKDRIDIKDYL